MSEGIVVSIERVAWWFHIVGILIFLNYLYFSKHLHILLAFPNTFYSDLNAKGKLDNLESVTNEVKLMMDPSADPFAAPADATAVPAKFGASDVQDLNWVQLLNAYSCTECGRCTSSCPANQTGKKLSPRKIMMDTRDRLEEVGKNIDLNKGVFVDDGKSLLNDYISTEELWACTSCNACVEECPINISPLSIIIDMRRYLVMEQSAAPNELNNVMTNIENNGAPWQYNQMDRLNWSTEA
jgi:heterodisulfide reductase subunit C